MHGMFFSCFPLQPKETKVHFFLDNEQTETKLSNGDADTDRLSRSADEIEMAILPNLHVSHILCVCGLVVFFF